MYVLKFGKRFDKEFEKLDNSIAKQIYKKIDKLKDNPQSGKPLLYADIRQLRIEMFRVFYSIENNRKEI